ELFATKLRGDYDYTRIVAGGMDGKGTGENYRSDLNDYPEGIDATEFLVSKGRPRGLCRHKATILVAILRHVGVPAELEAGVLNPKFIPKNPRTTEEIEHAYVTLPEQ